MRAGVPVGLCADELDLWRDPRCGWLHGVVGQASVVCVGGGAGRQHAERFLLAGDQFDGGAAAGCDDAGGALVRDDSGFDADGIVDGQLCEYQVLRHAEGRCDREADSRQDAHRRGGKGAEPVWDELPGGERRAEAD